MKRFVSLSTGVIILALVSAVPAAASSAPIRPMRGACSTAFTFIGQELGGAQVLRIRGTCRFTHLGTTSLEARQLVYPDLRIVSDSTYTAANGDQLRSHVAGQAMPTGPATVAFMYSEWYTGGSGRLSDVVPAALNAPPSAVGFGSADLATGTGSFQSEGWIAY